MLLTALLMFLPFQQAQLIRHQFSAFFPRVGLKAKRPVKFVAPEGQGLPYALCLEKTDAA